MIVRCTDGSLLNTDNCFSIHPKADESKKWGVTAYSANTEGRKWHIASGLSEKEALALAERIGLAVNKGSLYFDTISKEDQG